MAQSSRPIDIKPTSSTAMLTNSFFVSSSPINLDIQDDYLTTLPAKEPEPTTQTRSNSRLGLPQKWRPISDYQLLTPEEFIKYGIQMPKATKHSFKLYIKKRDIGKDDPKIYLIKLNDVGSFASEFEVLNGALHNLLVDGVIPTAHVIYDDALPGNPPTGICTVFDKTFKPVKAKDYEIVDGIKTNKVVKDYAITNQDLKNPRIVQSLAEIILLAFLLEEDDLHGYNFGRTSEERLIKRVDTGKAMWNYLREHPKLTHWLSRWGWRTKEDIFPIEVGEIEIAPNFKRASPRYCPGGSDGESLFSASSAATWFTDNAFTSAEIKVYKDPENLQKNRHFNYTKFKVATKFTLLTRDVIEELAKLHLRTRDGIEPVNHIKEYADHLEKRIAEVRKVLPQSEQFKKFVKSEGAGAASDILEEFDALAEKIEKKMKKPNAAKAYSGLFACLNHESPQASMSHAAIKQKWTTLDLEARQTPAISAKK